MSTFEPVDDHGIAKLRVPPHSIEAESAVLGALMLDNRAFDLVGDMLVDSDFYRYEHRLIFGVCSALIMAAKPADVITVFEQLNLGGKADEAGGLLYLNQLAQFVPSAANIRRHAEIIRENALRRRMISTSDNIATLAFNPQGKSAGDLLDAATASIIGLMADDTDADWEEADASMVQLLDRLQARADGSEPPDFRPTGLLDLDTLLNGGTRPGQLVIIGARPSMGKTALALRIADHVAINEGKNAAMFSMEMEKAEVAERRMAMHSRIHLTRIQRPERLKDYDWPKITHGVEVLRNGRFAVSDKPGLNINQVRTRARALKRRYGKLDLLVVDYLGLMPGVDPKAPRTYQIEHITQNLKALAKELRCTVLLLVQLSREVEKRVGGEPTLADLRDSGSIEQDADIVIFVHRPYRMNMDKAYEHYAKLIVAKNRNGPLGAVHAMYLGEHTLFMDWPENTQLPTGKAGPSRTANPDD